MNDYLTILCKTALFTGLTETEISSMLDCLSARISSYKKEDFILHVGDKVQQVGMVLTGSVLIIKEDFWGNRSILSEISSGSLFAETYACIGSSPLEVSVVASSDCKILFLDFHKILTPCSCACPFHTRLIHNLWSTLAQKNRILTKKLEHMSQKTTRDKLLSYLSAESLKAQNSSFSIPFNRQQLADYLSVDRSAMSGELGKLKKEGVLDYKKNTFLLKDTFSAD